MKHPLILVVDDDESLRRVTQLQLQEAGYRVLTAAGGEEALHLVEQHEPDLVMTDLKMPGSGMDVLQAIRGDHPEITVVLLTAFGTVQTAVEAMKTGAYDYITSPIDYSELLLAVSRALEHQHLVAEVRTLRSNLDRTYGFESMIGRSRPLLQVLEMASPVAQRDSTVLIRGETGTGKELLARAIHQASRRKDRDFVTINCGAIPKDLIESELFGYTRGSFTGAFTPKRGKVEAADRGTALSGRSANCRSNSR
jgi:two-component system NtrC family response regulator